MIHQAVPPRSLSYESATNSVRIIDQTRLPHALEFVELTQLDHCCDAIRSMQVRGAPLIGITAAYGVYLALCEDAQGLDYAIQALAQTRPTAVNLTWALQRCQSQLSTVDLAERTGQALALARQMEAEDIAVCSDIGDHGLAVLRKLSQACAPGRQRLNILTHCNTGVLATAGWGTALAIVYKAKAAGLSVHVWVDETRPRNQGASLTCWELAQSDIPHTLVVDNAGGLLMQRGEVDVCLVGSDRTTRRGDVCNKIGTYLKALAAHDNGIPFYVALPVSSIDTTCTDGQAEIPIEERSVTEVLTVSGRDASGSLQQIALAPDGTAACNYGFDITPARLVTGLITEKGVVPAAEAAIAALFD